MCRCDKEIYSTNCKKIFIWNKDQIFSANIYKTVHNLQHKIVIYDKNIVKTNDDIFYNF